MKLSSFFYLIFYVCKNPTHITNLLQKEKDQIEKKHIKKLKEEIEILECKNNDYIFSIIELEEKLKKEKKEKKTLRKQHHHSCKLRNEKIEKLKKTKTLKELGDD